MLFGPNYSNTYSVNRKFGPNTEYRIYSGFENEPNTNIEYQYSVLTIRIVRIIRTVWHVTMCPLYRRWRLLYNPMKSVHLSTEHKLESRDLKSKALLMEILSHGTFMSVSTFAQPMTARTHVRVTLGVPWWPWSMVTTPSSVWSAGGTGVPTPGTRGSMPGQESGVMCRLANCNLL